MSEQTTLIAEVLAAITSQPGVTYSELCCRFSEPDSEGRDVDRALQKLRKTGAAEYSRKGGWRATPTKED